MPSRRARRSRAASASIAAATAVLLSATPASSLSGQPITDSSRGYTAHILFGDYLKGCSGVLVHQNYVLTTANCVSATTARPVTGKLPEKTTVTVGRTDLNANTTGTVVNATDVIVHPERNVALLKLSKPVTNVTPAALSGQAPVLGETLHAAGFGRTTTTWAPDRLNSAQLNVTASTGTNPTLDLKPTGDSAVCQGDAGGPLTRENAGEHTLVALTTGSYLGSCLGAPEGETRRDARAIRVDDISQWLQLQTGPRWGAEKESSGAPAQELWGDFNGDGKTDSGLFYTYGAVGSVNRSGLWTQFGNGGKSDDPVKVWDSIASGTGSFNGNRSKAVTGDFNGDGKTDVGVFYNVGQDANGNNQMSLWSFISNGLGFEKPMKVWEGSGYNWDRAKPVTGDFNGDGKTDAGFLYNHGQDTGGVFHSSLWSLTSTGTGFSAPVKKWDNTAADLSSWNWGLSKPVTGDFNGDGKTDVGVLYNVGQVAGKNVTALWTFTGTPTGFNKPSKVWEDGGYNWDRIKPTAGDFDNDGKADIGFLYNIGQDANGYNFSSLWTLTSTGSAFGAPAKKWESKGWNWNVAKVGAGDFDGDGKADTGVYYDYGQNLDGTYRTGLWNFTSTGDGFRNPVMTWDSDYAIR
ncbi:trypsin-like serine protease (plasmid) [Streptomyces sp. BI20]|uniref:trypsin-like serine protease n=1 Tax=Streptomyces sp. BI20 TaxID=3403460 RepID=UPI003C784B95